jgi:hypothetical protein
VSFVGRWTYTETVKRRLVILLITGLLGLIPFEAAVANPVDPYPELAVGGDVPGTRVWSTTETSWPEFYDNTVRQGWQCPSIQTPNGDPYAMDGNGFDATSGKWFRVCQKNPWRQPRDPIAWQNYENELNQAKERALTESQAWNAANPGKQKCVQWGPIRSPDGGESSGGVCANPVEPGPGTTVRTEEAPAVSAPAETPQSTPAASEPAPTPVSNSNLFVEETQYQGNGYPFTKIYRGQLSTTDCPIGFQGANGIIVAIGIGTFTECWPVNAWAANRLGGEVWESFKASGGTLDVMAEVRRRENVENLKVEAKRVAQVAADLTPGVQRCSRWTGYGESGTECAYAFVSPSETTKTDSNSSTATRDSSTVISVPNGVPSAVDSTTSTSSPSPGGETITVTMIPIEPVEVETPVPNVSSANSEPLTKEDAQFYLIWFISRPELELLPV